MLSYNQVTNSEINNNGVSVKEIAPIMKLNLRGKTREFFTNVGKTLNMILPTEANTSSSSDKLTAIWLSCLLYTSPSPRDLSTSRMPSSA